MEHRAHASFSDDFLAWYVDPNLYTLDESFGYVEIVPHTAGAHAYNGTMKVEAMRYDNDYAMITSEPSYQVRRDGSFVFRARFKLSHGSQIKARIGLYFDDNNFLCLELDTDTDAAHWAIHSRAVSTSTRKTFAAAPDALWHTVEFRATGVLGDVTCVLDDNEADALTFVQAELHDSPMALWGYCEETANQTIGNVRALFVDYWAVAQGRVN